MKSLALHGEPVCQHVVAALELLHHDVATFTPQKVGQTTSALARIDNDADLLGGVGHLGLLSSLVLIHRSQPSDGLARLMGTQDHENVC